MGDDDNGFSAMTRGETLENRDDSAVDIGKRLAARVGMFEVAVRSSVPCGGIGRPAVLTEARSRGRFAFVKRGDRYGLEPAGVSERGGRVHARRMAEE